MLLLAAVSTLMRVWTPSDDASSSICVFRRCTGISCPGCGLTRGIAALMKGRLGVALTYHPLAVVVWLQLAFGALVWSAWSAGWIRRDLTRAVQWVLVFDVVALIAVWAVRLSTGTLPPG